ELWGTLLAKYGDKFFTDLKAQNPRFIIGGVPSAQALAAGEGGILIPTVGSVFDALINNGAPVGFAIPDVTTGVESGLALTNPSKAPHPCAGELFLSYIMHKDGNRAFFGGVRGAYGVFDKLPPGYSPSNADLIAQKPKINQLLGR